LADVGLFVPGSYRFIKGVFQYSGGVAAEPGFRIERARLTRPLPLSEGFDRIEAHLTKIGRPVAALCACELRSPEPFTESGFVTFNRQYIERLEQWGLIAGGVNPVARTNVCPDFEPPAEVVLSAFSYTGQDDSGAGSFIVAGSGEAREGLPEYRDSIVRFGETSPDAIRDKVRFVLDEMERRLSALGLTWSDAGSTQAYTVHNVGGLVADEFVARGAIRNGLERHYARPPVVGIEFEMDVRRPLREQWI
jgi:hypothetical protein